MGHNRAVEPALNARIDPFGNGRLHPNPMAAPPPTARPSKNPMRFASFGGEFAGSVLVPMLLGLWADHAWETEPWGVLIGGLVALILAGMSLAKLIWMIKEEQAAETANSSSNPPPNPPPKLPADPPSSASFEASESAEPIPADSDPPQA